LSRLAWKSRKLRGIPTLPQPRLRLVINLNRTFHVLRKPDILMCYQQKPVKALNQPLPEGMLGTKDVAQRLQITPRELRVILRGLGKGAGGERYPWKEN